MQKNLPLLAEQLEYGDKYTFRFNLTTCYTLVYLRKDADGKLLFYNETLNNYAKPMNYKRFTYLLRFKLERFTPAKIETTPQPKTPVELWEDEEPPVELCETDILNDFIQSYCEKFEKYYEKVDK